MLADADGQDGAHEVVHFGDGGRRTGAPVADINFALKIGDDFARIEGEIDSTVFGVDVAADVGERVFRGGGGRIAA